MKEGFYKALEGVFGLDINTILSGVGISFIMMVFFVVRFVWIKLKNKSTNYVSQSIFDVKNSIVDSKIEDIDLKNSTTQVFSIGGSIENSTIKNVKVHDNE